MSEQRMEPEAIRQAATAAGNINPHLTLQRLCRRLHNMTARLKQEYARANAGSMRSPVEEWLCDNYYMLEKESKQSIREIRGQARQEHAAVLMRVYHTIARVLANAMPPLNEQTVAAILETMNAERPLTERQFGFVPLAIKAALVHMAYAAVTDSNDVRCMAYAITGFGKLTSIDMQTVIQQCSNVEKILLRDPAGVYAGMSDDSRSAYRLYVARIAKATRNTEQQVALSLLEDAQRKNTHIGAGILRHPALCKHRSRRGTAALVLGAAVPLLLSAGAAWWTRQASLLWLLYFPLWEVLRIPIQQAALSGVDVSYFPRLDLDKLESKPATVVLVSTLLPKAAEAPALAGRLEQLYFSNADPDMYYCVLADLGEWDYPTDEKDESQIAATRKVIEDLNRQHGPRFLLFLRARVYNPTQRRYSGWERKRGAITEFIRFLKGDKTSLHTFVGDRAILQRVKFLLALDSDTEMLYESAQELVAAAMHPLNRPVVNADGIVTEGYGILVPKISTNLSSARATAFSRVMNGCGGVTAYETRDKDFYQDLFGESIFAGKGLIDVDAFYQVLDKRFPEGRVLSHDILEGAYLRCGFVSDVEMTDSAPASMTSWLSRLHRWLRGDWQNLVFIARRYRADGRVWKNPISLLSKYKLFDNLRRSLTPVAALLCLTAALFFPPRAAGLLAIAGLLAVMFPSLWAAAWSLCAGGVFTMSRKFFARTMPRTLELLAQALFLLVMLPAQAFLTLDAAVRSVWRTFVSRKRLLEWTTAAQSEKNGSRLALLRRYALPELFGVGYLLLAYPTALTLPGLCFALVLPVACLSARPIREPEHCLDPAERDTLLSYNAAMWRYYEDYATEQHHYLPPDNIQQSPVYRVAARTSPTNIGVMLLSVLAAYDFGFVDADELLLRTQRTLATVEQLPKWHGNLYNWYSTETLDTLKPEFVSTVDSGNFVCCLVAFSAGLRELAPVRREFAALAARVDALVETTDLTVLYDTKKRLFSIGYDVPSGQLSSSHYDFLMSEARLTSYFAVARKLVSKKHWGALGRTMSRYGSYAGPVSWTGTMFEYFMPHLLLPVYEDSLLGESLSYCLYCQKRRAKAAGVPWGISESAFYAFDNNLNYQYKAHGVQKLGVKRYLDRELVISPYSTLITLPFNPKSAMRNLARLRELGVYGRYGFYEAVDFTADRVGTGALAVTRSYMAHHIGMSMIASCNALFDGRMQKRFMEDKHMRSAAEFLQEKIAKSTVVYDSLKNAAFREEKQKRPRVREETRDPNPLAPRCLLLTNGELTDILTDTGAGWLCFGGIDLTRRDTDLLRRAQGVYTIVRMDGMTLPATFAPFYDPGAQYHMEQQEQCVTWYAAKKWLEVGVRGLIHPTISCQQRHIVVKNNTDAKQTVEVLCYLEPVLASYQDYSAHPAYAKLFVTARYDEQSRTLTFSRRNRDCTVDLFLTVGFLQDIDFTFETRRESLMRAPNGLADLLQFPGTPFPNHDGGVPDACCALRFALPVAAGGQQQATLLISAARSAAEGIQNIIQMRRIGTLEPKQAAHSPVLGDSLDARLGEATLGQLLFTTADCAENRAEKQRNTLGQPGLWPMGISGDDPIILLENAGDAATLEGYVRLHTSLRRLGVLVDLVVLCHDEAAEQELRGLVERLASASVLGARGGVFPLQNDRLSDEQQILLHAVARHIAGKGMPGEKASAPPFHPVRMHPIAPAPMPEEPELVVQGGAFLDGRFYVDKTSPLPWCHILANGPFGTLVSDQSPGYTWAINARENKLTPWFNDITTDNTGEMVVLYDGERWFHLTCGARASFAQDDARYEGHTAKVDSAITITVSGTGCAKYVDVHLRNRTNAVCKAECAYYLEPVLGVNRDTARHLCIRVQDGVLLMHNPYNTAVHCYAALAGTGSASPRWMNNRAAFLCGDWQHCELAPTNDPCATVILPVVLPAEGEAHLRFTLAYGGTADSAVFMASQRLAAREKPTGFVRIHTPDPHLDQYINHFAPTQILSSRVRGRTAFYQCGGAYGFRDQLQDACAYLLLDPAVTRRQILRCCAVQFEEGDVLHWWHDLPGNAGGRNGVRTRFSDDLLWLPYAVNEYVQKTGDESILSVSVHYLCAPPLAPSEQERYLRPERSGLREDVFAHCVRAIERGDNPGANGLPRIGCGDWNDGFSAVGRQGKGTSVWLALFLAIVLERFAKLCARRGESQREQAYLARAAALREAVDAHCWDGAWYVRAFFDNGEAMGSHRNEECQIDLLPQSFAVFAGMPQRNRVETALQHAWERLVDHKLRLVRLFDPPFQYSAQQPGYVKAYPPGLRENGGQYTHAAVWFAMALLQTGYTEEGWQVLDMLGPVSRASHPTLAEQYKLEPYYIAADLYTNPYAAGRGGWSMYTGASSWYYRAVLETLLGLTLRGSTLTLTPRLPAHWPRADIDAELRGTKLHITIRRGGKPGLVCDGQPATAIPLDGQTHHAMVFLGGSEK